MKRSLKLLIVLAVSLTILLGFSSTAFASGPPCSITIKDLTSTLKVTTPYTWSIEKTVPPTELTLAEGASGDVTYDLDVTKVAGESTVEGSMSCKIKADVNYGEQAKVDIKVYITEDGKKLTATEENLTNSFPYGDVTLNYAPTFTPKAGSSYAVAYEGTVYWDWSSSQKKWKESAIVKDSKGFTVENLASITAPISVTDTVGTLPDGITASPATHDWSDINDGLDESYTVTYTNNGADPGTYTVTNTAVINETEQNDGASITIKVLTPDETPAPTPTPKPHDPPEPRDERKVRWPDRTAPPAQTAAPVAVALPRTGGFIEWEWIALAGGMLTSCGGGLYLARRRRMKK